MVGATRPIMVHELPAASVRPMHPRSPHQWAAGREPVARRLVLARIRLLLRLGQKGGR